VGRRHGPAHPPIQGPRLGTRECAAVCRVRTVTDESRHTHTTHTHTRTHTHTHTHTHAHTRTQVQRVNCLAFNEDSSVLVSGSYDKTVKIWFAPSSGQHPLSVVSLVVSCRVVSCGSNPRFWRVLCHRDCRSRSFTPIQTLSEAKDSVSSLYISSEEIITAYVVVFVYLCVRCVCVCVCCFLVCVCAMRAIWSQLICTTDVWTAA
jgi:WD40 repeat protein